MCDEMRSAGYAELPDGSRFLVSRRGHRLTVELSVPCDLLRELFWHGGTGSDEDAARAAGRTAGAPLRRPPGRNHRRTPTMGVMPSSRQAAKADVEAMRERGHQVRAGVGVTVSGP